jgi:hypothetical protein
MMEHHFSAGQDLLPRSHNSPRITLTKRAAKIRQTATAAVCYCACLKVLKQLILREKNKIPPKIQSYRAQISGLQPPGLTLGFTPPLLYNKCGG